MNMQPISANGLNFPFSSPVFAPFCPTSELNGVRATSQVWATHLQTICWASYICEPLAEWPISIIGIYLLKNQRFT